MKHVKHTFFSSLVGLLLLAVMPVAGYADNYKRVIEACTNLVLDYAYFRDRPDAEGVASLFAEDAQLTVLGQTFVGRAAIAERIRDAAGGPIFRHMMSTIRIFPDNESHARGVSYVAVYTASAGQLPRPLQQPAA
ncbi:MAG: nuclear transport factor 2 family protein, partial [Pseudomonadales bacterium]|nr:nuclear transport factor 2 family protein [Pseudomonadales bacterium]